MASKEIIFAAAGSTQLVGGFIAIMSFPNGVDIKGVASRFDDAIIVSGTANTTGYGDGTRLYTAGFDGNTGAFLGDIQTAVNTISTFGTASSRVLAFNPNTGGPFGRTSISTAFVNYNPDTTGNTSTGLVAGADFLSGSATFTNGGPHGIYSAAGGFQTCVVVKGAFSLDWARNFTTHAAGGSGLGFVGGLGANSKGSSVSNGCVVGAQDLTGVRRAIAIVFSSSGSIVWQKVLPDVSGYFLSAGLSDSSVYVGGFVSSSGTLIKFDANGNLQWSLAGIGMFPRDMVVNSSDDTVYICDTNRVAKLNSSGTLQWGKRITINGRDPINSAIFLSGSSLFMAGSVTDSTQICKGFLIKLPISGLGNGTYIVGSNTVNILDDPFSPVSQSFNIQNGNRTFTTLSPSVASRGNTNSDISAVINTLSI